MLGDIIPCTRLDALARRVREALEHEKPILERWLRANVRLQVARSDVERGEAIAEWRAAREAMRYREEEIDA